jgi:hypothetical protein
MNARMDDKTPHPMACLPVGRCSIECIDNPEWGTWGVYEDRGSYYEIHGRAGGRVLDKAEAITHWRRVR